MIITDITNGISKALYTALGAPIYADYPKQNIKFPCFIVDAINPTQYNELGPVKRRVYDFDIMYFLDDTGDIDDTDGLREIAERMYDVLDIITAGERQILASDMHWRITDGVLHFFVTYTAFVMRVKDNVYMKKLEQNWGVTTNGGNDDGNGN